MPRVRVGGDPHYVTSSNVNSPTRKCSGTQPATRFTKGSNPAGDAVFLALRLTAHRCVSWLFARDSR